MGTSVIKDENAIVRAAVPLTSSTEHLNGYSSCMSGHLVDITFNALNIPPRTWTEIAVLSKPPINSSGVVIANSTINAYGRAEITTNGTLRVYHTNANTMAFYGIHIMYLTNA